MKKEQKLSIKNEFLLPHSRLLIWIDKVKVELLLLLLLILLLLLLLRMLMTMSIIQTVSAILLFFLE